MTTRKFPVLALLLTSTALAFDVEEFDDGLGEWEFTPQKIGRTTTDGWSVVADGSDNGVRANATTSSATYYWTLARPIDLTGAREPALDVAWTFPGAPYDSAKVQVGPMGATLMSDFTTILDVKTATGGPQAYTVDLAPWDETQVQVRVLLKKPTGVITDQPGLTVHRIGVTVQPEPPPPPPPPEILSIGSFNVQAFGLTKMDKVGVPEVIVSVGNRYDLLLVQEIRDKSGAAILELLDMLNAATDDDFALIQSDRLGRTVSKEQYAFFYRKSKLEVVTSYPYDDGVEPAADLFEREPFIVQFQSLKSGKDFAVLGLHTSPETTPEELGFLDEVRADVAVRLDEDDLMLMGDFNAGCSYLTPTEAATLPIVSDPEVDWQIPDSVDTTTSTTFCPYDRILTSGLLNDQTVLGSASVYHFDVPLGLSPTFTKTVSDHYPVEVLIDLAVTAP